MQSISTRSNQTRMDTQDVDMSIDISAATSAVETTTGLQIHTYRTLDSLSGTLVVEINHEWLLRFANTTSSPDKKHKYLGFLRSFAKTSPLAVPKPVYITDAFVGYKRIAGDPFYPGDPFDSTEIDRLSDEDKHRIAKQL